MRPENKSVSRNERKVRIKEGSVFTDGCPVVQTKSSKRKLVMRNLALTGILYFYRN